MGTSFQLAAEDPLTLSIEPPAQRVGHLRAACGLQAHHPGPHDEGVGEEGDEAISERLGLRRRTTGQELDERTVGSERHGVCAPGPARGRNEGACGGDLGGREEQGCEGAGYKSAEAPCLSVAYLPPDPRRPAIVGDVGSTPWLERAGNQCRGPLRAIGGRLATSSWVESIGRFPWYFDMNAPRVRQLLGAPPTSR